MLVVAIAVALAGIAAVRLAGAWLKYRGRRVITFRGQPFGEIQWAGSQPALLGADNVSVEWRQVPAGQLHETLAAALPVCFACHMARTLVREHPDLVVDRSGPQERPGPSA
jgi:hypothetical protein